jgi:hypothetical protein
MRFRLDPTSPSGLSVLTPPVTQNRRSQGNGYITDNISGLLIAGTNVTITGNGTKASPYSIASTGGGGGGSGITRTVTVTSGSFTAGSTSATDYVYLHAGAHNATLPTASSNSNRYTFKNKHSAAVTVTRAGADTIEGGTSISVPVGASVDLISDGTSAWSVI